MANSNARARKQRSDLIQARASNKFMYERVTALLTELRAKAYAHWGSCATGLKDYQHSHSSASDCSACGERSMAAKMVEKLEEALLITAVDKPCYLTDDKLWCVAHSRDAKRCGREV